MLFALLSLIALSYSSELESAQSVVTARSIAVAQTASDCYIVSSKYQTRPQGASGDIFAAAMGTGIGGFPYTGLGYISGNVDLDFYNGTLAKVNIDAQAAVTAWAFVALGEFCDNNGVEGYQPGTTDYILNYFYAPTATFTQQCGQTIDAVSGLPSYYSSIQSNPAPGSVVNNFNTSCYVFPNDVNRAGRSVGAYTYKCDVRVDYSNLWTLFNPLNCPDDRRKIGLMLNIAGAAYDADISISNNFNRAGANIADAERITFGGGRLSFVWDNYVRETSIFSGTTGSQSRVTYGYLQNNGTTASYNGATVVEQVIFSFATPKSAGKNLFYWDPSITVTAGAASLFPFFGMILAFLSAVFLL
jgi:hypothetical protein